MKLFRLAAAYMYLSVKNREWCMYYDKLAENFKCCRAAEDFFVLCSILLARLAHFRMFWDRVMLYNSVCVMNHECIRSYDGMMCNSDSFDGLNDS